MPSTPKSDASRPDDLIDTAGAFGERKEAAIRGGEACYCEWPLGRDMAGLRLAVGGFLLRKAVGPGERLAEGEVGRGVADERLQVVMGAYRYAVFPGWNRVPLGHISQLAVDNAGRLYVFQRTGAPIVVLTPDGDLAASWDAAPINDPHGIFITADDRVLLVDRNAHQVLIFATDGRLLTTLGERHRPRFGLPFNHPTDVAVAPSGDIYVSDGYGNAHVHRFAPNGSYCCSWGGIGSGPGEFSTPHGIWVTTDGRVLVGDRENNRVQIFTGDGAYLGEWGGLYHPMDIYGSADGTIFVTDQAPRIVAFSPDGEVIGRCSAAKIYNHGIWGDGAGNLFLCEHTGTITKLARST